MRELRCVTQAHLAFEVAVTFLGDLHVDSFNIASWRGPGRTEPRRALERVRAQFRVTPCNLFLAKIEELSFEVSHDL